MSDLRFDRYQFEGRGAFPASAETRIAFSDYRRMHTEQHNAKPAAWVPPFALNDSQLRQVLVLRAWRYISRHAPLPSHPDREAINTAATAKALKGHPMRKGAPAIQRAMQARHKATVRKAGGYLQLLAAIAFRAWRLGMDSVAVAETLGTTPQAVRVALWRLRAAAKDLGFVVSKTSAIT